MNVSAVGVLENSSVPEVASSLLPTYDCSQTQQPVQLEGAFLKPTIS
jgi:hypothetical protein